MDTVWTVATIVLGLEVVVLSHLLGHFLVAKLLRVPLVIHLSFGPAWPRCRIARGCDTYVLAWFPLGGYITVRLPETPGDAVPAIWKRLLVAGGGVAANVLLACVCFSVAMSHGTERWAAVVGDVDAGAGLAEGHTQRRRHRADRRRAASVVRGYRRARRDHDR